MVFPIRETFPYSPLHEQYQNAFWIYSPSIQNHCKYSAHQHPLDRPDLLSRRLLKNFFLCCLIKCLHACLQSWNSSSEELAARTNPLILQFKVCVVLHLQHPMPQALLEFVHHVVEGFNLIKSGSLDWQTLFLKPKHQSASSAQDTILLITCRNIWQLLWHLPPFIATDIPTPPFPDRCLNHQRPWLIEIKTIIFPDSANAFSLEFVNDIRSKRIASRSYSQIFAISCCLQIPLASSASKLDIRAD